MKFDQTNVLRTYSNILPGLRAAAAIRDYRCKLLIATNKENDRTVQNRKRNAIGATSLIASIAEPTAKYCLAPSYTRWSGNDQA